MRRSARLGRRSRARVRAGGPVAQGRPSLPLAEYRALVADIKGRARGRCEVPWCRLRKPLDPAHVIPRSAGGADTADNIVAVCRSCHRKMDELRSIEVTRLLAPADSQESPLGGEVFVFRDVLAATVYSYRRPKEAV